MTNRIRLFVVCLAAAVMLADSVSAYSRDEGGQEARLEHRVFALAAPSTPYYAFFQETVRSQFHWAGDPDTRPVLYLTFFPQSLPQAADNLLVDHTGQVSINRRTSDQAPRDSNVIRSLEPTEVLELRKRLEFVHPSYVTPSISRLVLFSFVRRGVWCTYAFDAQRLPKSYFAALNVLRLKTFRPVYAPN
jgi:hypothetical protein